MDRHERQTSLPPIALLKGFSEKHKLTAREEEILACLVNSIVANEEIAERLTLSPFTVSNHIKNILEKTDAANKTEVLSQFINFLISSHEEHLLVRRPPRILIVDDVSEFADLLREKLSDRKIEVAVETNPLMASRRIKEFGADVILCDLNMPNVSGVEVLRSLRAPNSKSPSMFLMTGQPDPHIEGLDTLGNIEVFRKPIHFPSLYFKIIESMISDERELSRFRRMNCQISATTDHGRSAIIRNLCDRGCFLSISGEELPKPNTIIAIDFALPERGIAIHAEGRVAWTRVKDQQHLPAGVGVEFLDLLPQMRQSIHDYIKRHKLADWEE
jgi:DNA-binding NarL/FixJ family response regulator